MHSPLQNIRRGVFVHSARRSAGVRGRLEFAVGRIDRPWALMEGCFLDLTCTSTVIYGRMILSN